LAGNRVVAADTQLGTIRLLYGDTAKTHMTFEDGQTKQISGVPTASSFTPGTVPTETTIHAPLPALKKISLMRLAEANDVDSQVKAMHWAAEQSDIVIWCTTRFVSIEKTMWSHMPGHVCDNAFALRTTLSEFDRKVSAARSDLGKRVGDEFAFVIAADLKAALAAQVSVPVDTAAMKSSGATYLISTLLKEINQGRENSLDQARLLLAKYSAGDVSKFEDTASSDDENLKERVEEAADPQPEKATLKTVSPSKPRTGAVSGDFDDLAEAADESDIGEVINDLAGEPEQKEVKTTRAAAKPKRKNPNIFPMFELDKSKDDTSVSTTDEVAEIDAAGEYAKM